LEELFLYIESLLAPQLSNWTILSEGIKITSPDLLGQSLEEYARACRDGKKCHQYQHHKDTCDFSYTFRLSHSQQLDHTSDRKLVSGWVLERIKDFKKRNSPCGNARWVYSNP